MDVTEKVSLVSRPPTEEVVTQDELLELFKTNSKKDVFFINDGRHTSLGFLYW